MRWLWTLILIVLAVPAWAAPNHVEVRSVEGGRVLTLDGEPFFVRGMNWGYMPVGENYSYDFWGRPDAWIEDALRPEMALLKSMGVNSIRQYPGIPPRWVEWIYDNYGITTMINPLTGRYGITVDGRWVPVVDYSDPATREAIKAETMASVETYKDTRGVLLFLLGNENNYGLSWSSFEIEALPEGEQQAARAVYLYSLWGELVDAIHAVDPHHPVAICNGDLQYLDLVAEHVPNLDVMGSNVYRGRSSGDLFQRVEDELGVPFVYTEFGADAYDARREREDSTTQALYVHAQWQEIYEQAAGVGRVGNAIGGYQFQWTDGWWKYLQETNLDVHDTHASWPNDAYPEDWVEGSNNMNEEWWGIAAIGPTRPDGTYAVYPRPAFYVLQEAWRLDPYAQGTTLDAVRQRFAGIDPASFADEYATALIGAEIDRLVRASVSEVRVELSMFGSGGSERETTVDHLESFYAGFRAQPVPQLQGEVVVNVLGNVPTNRIDEIFYESRGRDLSVVDDTGEEVSLARLERVKVYRASFDWDHAWFRLEGFHRKGRYHWGYEGDFFGLYPETNYGPAIDTYDADAPTGVMFSGKRALRGLKLAVGPQIYWGANPSVIGKYRHEWSGGAATIIHHEDLAEQATVASSVAIPEPLNRRTTLAVEGRRGPVGFTVGGLMSGTTKIGWTYRAVRDAKGDRSYAGSGYDVLEDRIVFTDTLAGKAKVTFEQGPVHLYVQGAYKGLVADSGADQTVTFTGWRLEEDGRGNQTHALAGVAIDVGRFQIAPNFLWQKPLEGPLPSVDDAYDPLTGWYWPRLAPRNFRDDPFAVLGNRETIGGELLIVYDPTPGSWFWMWNNDQREDAPFAGALDFVYRHQPTSRDANFGFTEEGDLFAFDGAPPAADVWEAWTRLVFVPRGDLRLFLDGWAGTGQARGDDPRLVLRWGGQARVWWRKSVLLTAVRFDDWGPYDYHRDFNLTFPVQVLADLSTGITLPKLDRPWTHLGVQFKHRTLDQFSPALTPLSPGQTGNEWELGSYVKIAI